MDLAFCSYHENSQNHWIPFLEDEIWAVVPNGHPLAGCEELSLAQLASEPFILEDRAYDYDISRVIQEAGVHPNVRWTSKDELAILAMVRLELGVSVMPALYLHEDHPGVTVRPLVPRAHRQLGARQQRFAALAASLDALSPLKVLGRGYAMAQASDGTVLRSSGQVQEGDRIHVQLGQGALDCTVDHKEE